MAGKVVRLRPRRHDAIAEALQLALELPLGLQQSSLDDLAEALGRYEPASTWTYTMISREQQRLVVKLINAGPKPAITSRVWLVVLSHIQLETGEIMAGRARIAEDAETTPQEASRALSRLADMGALSRLRPGRYAINPHVGWAGSLAKREAAAKDASSLRVMEGGRGTPT
ncbi:hypothetical protein [Roseicella aquatilis]|uniref:Plasmid replication protein RepL domain-containing protein n=1 Tax=Roseicella aquatilis TaxID=2527868 RepID=A0A4R4D263_9PROT|nr:hypothetical protein [Roseicella aquatilis]TCZ52258.1 hypothetical protein EXY23_26350 [Roseicella aquatilis]